MKIVRSDLKTRELEKFASELKVYLPPQLVIHFVEIDEFAGRWSIRQGRLLSTEEVARIPKVGEITLVDKKSAVKRYLLEGAIRGYERDHPGQEITLVV